MEGGAEASHRLLSLAECLEVALYERGDRRVLLRVDKDLWGCEGEGWRCG